MKDSDAIVARLISGDKDAKGDLYFAWEKDIARKAAVLTKEDLKRRGLTGTDPDLCDELKQVGAVKILELADKFAEGAVKNNFTQYINKCLENAMKLALKAEAIKSVKYAKPRDIELPTFVELDESSEDESFGREHSEYADVDNSDFLAAICQSAIEAAVVAGLKTKELKQVAADLKIPLSTAYKIKDRLLRRLEEEYAIAP